MVTIDVIANDSDPDGTIDPTTVEVADDPDNGTALVDDTDGSIMYVPDPGFAGNDVFTYTVRDNEACVSNEASVTVTVQEVADERVEERLLDLLLPSGEERDGIPAAFVVSPRGEALDQRPAPDEEDEEALK